MKMKSGIFVWAKVRSMNVLGKSGGMLLQKTSVFVSFCQFFHFPHLVHHCPNETRHWLKVSLGVGVGDKWTNTSIYLLTYIHTHTLLLH